jgi:hypothetical protein
LSFIQISAGSAQKKARLGCYSRASMYLHPEKTIRGIIINKIFKLILGSEPYLSIFLKNQLVELIKKKMLSFGLK